MSKVMIDREKCIGCGVCVRDCVSECIKLTDGKAVFTATGCIGCGHCYAVCPQEAVSIEGMETDNGEMRSMTEIDSGLLLQAMKSRRSMRAFKSAPVEKDKLNMIIEAGRYCPTAANREDVAFTVLGSRQAEAEAICVNIFRKGAQTAGKISAAVRDREVGDHFFFKGAPLVIVVSAKNAGNANLASSYMELMAESLGLGVLYSGFFVMCTKVSRKLRTLLALPEGHKTVTCLVIGYPNVEYRRIPGRKPAAVKIL